MILAFRAASFFLTIAFAYFFGDTSERFLLDVLRRVVPLEASNAWTFNGIHLITVLSPLAILGWIFSISLSGEPDLKRRFWLGLWGVLCGLAAFRAYQVWWVFRGGIDEGIESWSQSLSFSQLYFLERIFPFLILGGFSALFCSFGSPLKGRKLLDSLLAAFFLLLWLTVTRKLQDLIGFGPHLGAFLCAFFSAFCTWLLIEKLNGFLQKSP